MERERGRAGGMAMVTKLRRSVMVVAVDSRCLEGGREGGREELRS
jgi:hypothetical protein